MLLQNLCRSWCLLTLPVACTSSHREVLGLPAGDESCFGEVFASNPSDSPGGMSCLKVPRWSQVGSLWVEGEDAAVRMKMPRRIARLNTESPGAEGLSQQRGRGGLVLGWTGRVVNLALHRDSGPVCSQGKELWFQHRHPAPPSPASRESPASWQR